MACTQDPSPRPLDLTPRVSPLGCTGRFGQRAVDHGGHGERAVGCVTGTQTQHTTLVVVNELVF